MRITIISRRTKMSFITINKLESDIELWELLTYVKIDLLVIEHAK